MKTIYTKDVPLRPKVGEPEVPVVLPPEKVGKLLTKAKIAGPNRQKSFVEKNLSESKKNEEYQNSIDHLEKRIKQLERQVKLLLATDSRHDKAHNYLKERVATLTNKVNHFDYKK